MRTAPRGPPGSVTLDLVMPRFLIADDNAGFRRAARALLTGDDPAEVEEAATAEEAIARVLELRPDLVLLDVMFGDADGRVVAARLLALPDPPRVLLMSARQAEDLELPSSSTPGGERRPVFVTKTALCPEVVRDALAA
jgi:CheY-like chemotaxis protein